VGEKKRSHLRGVDEGIDGLSIWIPRNARNAAEIHGFCAAVPEVRIHLPPAKSPVRTRFWARQRLLTKSGMGIYNPVTVSAVTKSLGDPAMPTLGLPQFALGVALLGRGQAKGLWTCAITDLSNHKSGAVWVAGATRTAEVFFVATAPGRCPSRAGRLRDELLDERFATHL
jgi:hypothetical protein